MTCVHCNEEIHARPDPKEGRRNYWLHMHGERCKVDGDFIDYFAEPDGVLDAWHTSEIR